MRSSSLLRVEAERPLLPAEYAVLGLLAGEPQHGYELARRWQDSPLHEVFPVEQSVLYGYLRILERRGLLDWEERKVGNRPPRKIYRASEAGWEVLRPWLRAPVQRLREVRLDLLLKVYVIRLLDPRAERALIERQVTVCEQYLVDARARLDGADDFTALVLRSRTSAAEATLAWLRAWNADHVREQAS